MKKSLVVRALAGAWVLSLGLALVGCGGGGGGGGSSATPAAMNGSVAAGVFKHAIVKVYDATTLDLTKLATAATLVPATETDGNGQYSVTLPAGFSNPVYIVVSAKPAGSAGTATTMADEIYGETPVTSLSLCSVVPAASGSTLTGSVTPFTNLMCSIVANKVGKSDVNAAINQAANLVNQMIGMDPVTSDPVNDPAMVARLAALSNISRPGSASACAAAVGNEAKVSCTINALAAAITPMAANYNTSSSSPASLALDATFKASFVSAMNALNISVVGSNSSVTASQLAGEPQTASAVIAALPANLTPNAAATLDGLAQAKQFFANLRTGILPYSNSNGTGFLDTEQSKLNTEFNQLTTSPYKGLNELTRIVSWAKDLHDGTVPSGCNGSTASASCFDSSNGLTVALTNSGTAWAFGTFATGTIAFDSSDTQMTVDGYIPPMTTGAGVAKVGNPGGGDATATSLKLTKSSIAGADMYEYTLVGTLKDMQCTGSGIATCTTPVFELAFGSGTKLDINQPASKNTDETKTYANFVGTFITANYSFTGVIEAKNIQAQGVVPNQNIVGGTVSFTGTINGTGLAGVDSNANNNFNIMVGKLEGTVDGASYNPNLAKSATNFQKYTLSFTGTVFKSATDLGLKLVVTQNDTGWDSGTLTVSYNDYNKGISVTGSGPYNSHAAPGTANSQVVLSDGNGISVNMANNITNTKVMKGNSVLANIQGSYITYADQTVESLM